MALPWAVLLITTVACERPITIDAPPPVATGALAAPELPPAAVSVIDAPISIDLGETLQALEAAVPTTFGDIERRIRNPSNRRQEFAFEATRAPFRVALTDGLLTLGTVVSYEGRGWYDATLAPDVTGSCGTEGDRPRLRAQLQSPITLDADWRIRTKVHVAELFPLTDTDRDACRVTLLNIDVTDRVSRAVRSVLRRELPKVDRKLAGWDLKGRVEGWYNQMNRPIHVADSVWLLLRPTTVRLGEISTNDTALLIQVRLFANPVIVSGPKPDDIRTPLPPLSEPLSEVGDSARVLLAATIDYDVATTLLRERFTGQSFSRLTRSVTITDVQLAPVGDGRLALGVRFSGALEGEGWLVGTPQLDTGRAALTVPDLDFDVATGDLLVQGLEFLRTPAVLEQLRAAAVLPLREPLEALRVKVERAINRELTDGVSLAATLVRGRLIDVTAMPNALVVRAEAAGRLALDVDRELHVPDR